MKIINTIVVSASPEGQQLVTKEESIGLFVISMIRKMNYKVMDQSLRIIGNIIVYNEKFCSKIVQEMDFLNIIKHVLS